MNINVPAAYEQALATILRGHFDVGKDTVIRAWQNLRQDSSWADSPTGDRKAQTIDIRATPPALDENQVNYTTTAEIECRVKAADDRDHAIIRAMYEACQEMLDTLFDQFRYGVTEGDTDLLAAFDAVILAECGATVGRGGLTFGDGTTPWEEDGYNCIAVSFVYSYSRQ